MNNDFVDIVLTKEQMRELLDHNIYDNDASLIYDSKDGSYVINNIYARKYHCNLFADILKVNYRFTLGDLLRICDAINKKIPDYSIDMTLNTGIVSDSEGNIIYKDITESRIDRVYNVILWVCNNILKERNIKIERFNN